MSGSVLLGSSALTFEKWQGHCTARTAYIHTKKIQGFPQWKWCIASMLHPWQFSKKLLSGPSRRNILPQLGFLWLPALGEVDRSLFLVLAFSLWKSMQKHRPLSFLHTNTTALHNCLWLGQIVPNSIISFTCAQTSSTIRGVILQNLSLKGLSSRTLISCFAKSIQPISPGSRERMSWYSGNRPWAPA